METSLIDLQIELRKCQERLKKITRTEYTGLHWDSERQEVYGEEVSYNVYYDKEEAMSLMRRIEYLEERIRNFGQEERIRKQIQKEKEEKAHQNHKKQVKEKALELYETAVDEYNRKNIFAKAAIMLAGKKPKVGLKEHEILEQYHGEAEYIVSAPDIRAQIARIEANKKKIIAIYGNNPSDDAIRRRNVALSLEDDKIKKLEETLRELEIKKTGNKEELEKYREKQRRSRYYNHDERVEDVAKELYETALGEYNKKNIFEKASIMFAGKKPRKNLTDKEIMAQYGGEAEYLVSEPQFTAKIQELEQQKEKLINYYASRDDLTEEQRKEYLDQSLRSIDGELARLESLLESKRNGIGK